MSAAVDMIALNNARGYLADRFGEHDGWAGSIRDAIAAIQSAEAALLAQSAAYEALVARCSELAAKLDRQAEENYTDRGNALSRCADDIRLLLVREGGDHA